MSFNLIIISQILTKIAYYVHLLATCNAVPPAISKMADGVGKGSNKFLDSSTPAMRKVAYRGKILQKRGGGGESNVGNSGH